MLSVRRTSRKHSHCHNSTPEQLGRQPLLYKTNGTSGNGLPGPLITLPAWHSQALRGQAWRPMPPLSAAAPIEAPPPDTSARPSWLPADAELPSQTTAAATAPRSEATSESHAPEYPEPQPAAEI